MDGGQACWRLVAAKLRPAAKADPVTKTHQLPDSKTPLQIPKAHSNPLVSIILTSLSDPDIVYACIHSILSRAIGLSYEIVVSLTSTAPEFLHPHVIKDDSLVKVLPLATGDNRVECINHCASQAKGRWLVVIGPYCVPTGNFWHAIEQATSQKPMVWTAQTVSPEGRIFEAGLRMTAQDRLERRGWQALEGIPQYNYVQAVAYSEGNGLIIPKKLFNLGGRLSRDAGSLTLGWVKFCTELRRMGQKLWLQPQFKVVRFLRSLDKARPHIRIPPAVSSSIRDRQRCSADQQTTMSKGRILIIESRTITPDRDSASYRLSAIIEIMQSLNFQVTVAALNLEYHDVYVGNLQQRGVEVLYKPYVQSIEGYIENNAKRFDYFFLSRIHVASRLIDFIKTKCPDGSIIYDTVDLHFIREQRAAELAQSKKKLKAANEIRKREIHAAQLADITLVVSPDEKKVLETINDRIKVAVVSNIHSIHEPVTPFEKRKNLLFIGGFAHQPNIDAVTYYCQAIEPLIQQVLTEIQTYVIGSDTPPEIYKLATKSVIIKGYVKDLKPYFCNSRVFIAPLRFGAGVKGKVNMSMSYGLPVVASTIAAEGINMHNHFNGMIADEPQQFAQSVVRLYQDQRLWERLSANSVQNVRTCFSPEAAYHTLAGLLKRN